eukprot:1158735-Pelagomonas_calceolata.AAC.5
MKQSPTNQWFQAYYRAGGKQADLVVHYDQAASYDGIAGVCGCGCECGRVTLAYRPLPEKNKIPQWQSERFWLALLQPGCVLATLIGSVM